MPAGEGGLPIQLDRARKIPLSAHIYSAIRESIENGRLASGARLPSWQDLAAQLGVSRGTVRVAYERLIAEQFTIGLGPAGTRVAERRSRPSMPDRPQEAPLLEFGSTPLVFQMGVPSQDAFPFKLWSRILTRETRQAAAGPLTYPDPRGDPELRKEIAAYLGLARGIRCSSSQVLVTGGFSGALGLAIRGLQLGNTEAWIEDPSFPLTRTALDLAGMHVTAAPVDAEGLDVAVVAQTAAAASLAVVTPGQQAPLGVTMSLSRRLTSRLGSPKRRLDHRG
ncbi:MAG: GntR family transcriptional regulator [Bradyrhizobium sp.]|nr:GntR family transcriptional regulator [Bradyrhizobium sp.]